MQGASDTDRAPILFTTHEMLRRKCQGWSFTDTACYHFHGRPRNLRVWDEAFLPAKEELLRRDSILKHLADLREVDSDAAEALEALSGPLWADGLGNVVRAPQAATDVHRALQKHLRNEDADRLPALGLFAGREGVVAHSKDLGLHLAGAVLPLPRDFAPCLILDASGRVRETYKEMEARGTLKCLPGFTADYSPLRIHHWRRAASRTTMKEDKDRHEVLASVAGLIKAEDDNEPWLIIHPMKQPGQVYSVVEDLRGLVANPDRLSFIHWGNHHGSNAYRLIRRVVVLGLWRKPKSVYSALYIAAGGDPCAATDEAVKNAIEAGEHCHHLLQAICRASVRNGAAGACGDCEVYIIDKLKELPALLHRTFPGAVVASWEPEEQAMPKGALKVSMAIEEELRASGGEKVSKAAVRTRLGIGSEALRKALSGSALQKWMAQKGLVTTHHAFEVLKAA